MACCPPRTGWGACRSQSSVIEGWALAMAQAATRSETYTARPACACHPDPRPPVSPPTVGSAAQSRNGGKSAPRGGPPDGSGSVVVRDGRRRYDLARGLGRSGGAGAPPGPAGRAAKPPDPRSRGILPTSAQALLCGGAPRPSTDRAGCAPSRPRMPDAVLLGRLRTRSPGGPPSRDLRPCPARGRWGRLAQARPPLGQLLLCGAALVGAVDGRLCVPDQRLRLGGEAVGSELFEIVRAMYPLPRELVLVDHLDERGLVRERN